MSARTPQKFRAFITRDKLVSALGQMGLAGYTPEDFKLYNFGVLHELFCSPGNDLSAAYHGSNLRAYSVRYSGQ